jgi:hypothetical protein
MREIRSSGSVGERGGNEPLYPETMVHNVNKFRLKKNSMKNYAYFKIKFLICRISLE